MNVAGDHVVIGAGGGTGSAVVRELAGRDLRVRAVIRSGKGDVPEGVEQVAAESVLPKALGRRARARPSSTTAHSLPTRSGPSCSAR